MNSQTVAEIIRHTLMTAFWISLPLLLVGFLIGIATSLVQILTSMQDPGLATIPRLAAFLVGFLFFMPWMMAKSMSYTSAILSNLAHYAR
jgi:flagellar biosynthetic protein FliQ